MSKGCVGFQDTNAALNKSRSLYFKEDKSTTSANGFSSSPPTKSTSSSASLPTYCSVRPCTRAFPYTSSHAAQRCRSGNSQSKAILNSSRCRASCSGVRSYTYNVMGPIFRSCDRLPEIVRSTERRSPGAASSIEMSPVVSGNGSNKSLAGDQPHNWFEPRASVLVAAPQTNFSVLACMCWLLEPKVAMAAAPL